MGWTSVAYSKAEHTSLTKKQAFEFITKEFWNYPIAMWHFKKAKDQWEHNEFYALMQSPQGKNFIMVIIIDIKDGEIYWKEIEESMGPAYCNCPKDMFKFVVAPNGHAIKWREQCESKNIKYQNYEERCNQG